MTEHNLGLNKEQKVDGWENDESKNGWMYQSY